jgi:F0F1-type ATP synthase delta subunit
MAELTIDMTYGSALFQVAQDLKKKTGSLKTLKMFFRYSKKKKNLAHLLIIPQSRQKKKRSYQENF